MLKQLQQQFQKFCTNGDAAIAEHIFDSEKIDAKKRLDIYFNAYRIRLHEILKEDYPKLLILLGEDQFKLMFTDYLQQFAPSHFSARYFGENLAKFLQQHQTYKNLPVLAEMAHFEWNLGLTLDTANGTTANFSTLQQIDSEKWPQLCLKFHPSLQFNICKWNTIKLWLAIDNNQAQIAPQLLEQAVTWVCWRDKELKTQFSSLNAIEEIIFFNILKGENFATVCDDLSNVIDEDKIPYELISILKAWFNDDMVAMVYFKR